MSEAASTREWKARPVVGWLVRIVVFATPIALSIFVTSAMTKLVTRPSGVAPNIAWWVYMSLVGTSVLYATEVVMRRLLPLATLLKLTLVFPDHAPARFRVALRTGTPKQLARKLRDADEQGLGETPQEAAEKLLELVAALSVHDRLTRGHCERVRAYTDVITKELGLSAEDAAKMHWAAMIHDIGKLDVPAEILQKPTRLTDEEFEIIKTHPQAGARIAAPLAGWLGEWFHAIDEHHERWDGKGYPFGLAGTDISIAGRIAAVADVYDVITAARSYKKPQPAAQARTELARCAGTQFDPEIVRAFLGVSLGRLRLMMGPLAWLSDLPVIGKVPMAPAAGAAVSAVAAVGALAFGGFLHTEAESVAAAPPVAAVFASAADIRPVAFDATETIESGHTSVIDLRSRSGWPDGTTVRLTGTPTAGTVEIDASGRVRYIAPADYVGTVTIPYEACNDSGCTTGHITIQVVKALAAVDDEIATEEDTPVDISILGNDTAVDGPLSLAHVAAPTYGRVTIRGSTVSYQPPVDFNGLDQFTYGVADKVGNTATAVVSVHVQPVNDASSFVVGVVPSVPEDAGPQLVAAWVTAIAAGPADESEQSVTFAVRVDDASLFSVAPAVAADGTLTYMPAANTHGSTTVHVTATDSAGAMTAEQTATLTITAVNDLPSFVVGGAVSVAEDDAAQSVSGWVTGTSAGPADESGQSVSFVVSVDDASLFSVAPAVAADGTLTFTLAADANGSTTVRVIATDSAGATSAEQTATLTIAAVNDLPSFVVGAAVSVAEDDAAQSLSGWVTGTSAGPADESGQSVSFVVSVDDASLFSVAPAVAADGTLTFTLAADANGSTTVRVAAADSAGATSAEQTATLTITAVNDLPSFVVGAAVSVAEDDAAQSLSGWVTGTSAGPADESGQSVSFVVSVDDASLFSVAPAVAADGTLTFTLAADANGSTTVHVIATDSAGASSAEQTANLTISAVNDVPSFVVGAAVSVTEDDAAQSLSGWVTVISAGPADESGQSVSFVVSVDDASLFSAGPAVAADGTLTLTPATNANGSTVIHVVASDSAGASSVEQTATLTITAVNDVPSFVVGAAVSVAEDAAAQSVSGWVTAISAGPADESGQSVTFAVSVDDATLFSVVPALAADGTLTFTPATNANGSTTVRVIATDSAGASSAEQTATLTITAVNDAPRPQDDGYLTQTNLPLVVVAPGLLGNDWDEDGDAVTVSFVDDPTNGSVIFAADGSFTYTPDPGFTGSDTFNYLVTDGAGGTAQASVTVTVNSLNTSSTYYLRPGAPAANNWQLSTTASTDGTVLDYDNDGVAGLTIDDSNGNLSNTDPDEYQNFDLVSASPITFNGPVTLHLAAQSQGFLLNQSTHIYAYIQDCATDGTNCVLLSATDVHISRWSLSPGWVERSFNLGDLDHTVLNGRMLRMKLLTDHHPLLVAMSQANASRIDFTQ